MPFRHITVECTFSILYYCYYSCYYVIAVYFLTPLPLIKIFDNVAFSNVNTQVLKRREINSNFPYRLYEKYVNKMQQFERVLNLVRANC